MECQRTSPQLQWKDVERSASGSDGAGPPAGCYSYSALCGTGGVESSSPMWLHGERSEGGGISRAVIPRRGRKPAMLLVSRQTIGIALFGLTCLGQALVSPFSIKLLACFSMPLCALLSGWILSGSFLLAGYLLSPAFLPPCRILAFCIAYAGISGLGGGLLHGLPFGERRPHEGDTSQGAVGENRATGLFFAFRCLAAAVIPLVHSFAINPENLSPAVVAPVSAQVRQASGITASALSVAPRQRPPPQQFIGGDSWASRERFYLHEEVLRRLPLTLMGLGVALAFIQLIAAFCVRERESRTGKDNAPCVALVEEESRLITHISVWPAYGDPERACNAETSPPCGGGGASTEASPEEVVRGHRTPGGSEVRGFRLGAPGDRVRAYCLVGVLTALHGMSLGLVQSAWRFVGQEEFWLSDQAVAYSHAGSIAVLLLFAFFFAPFFTRPSDTTEACYTPSADESLRFRYGKGSRSFTPSPALWCISGLLLASESFVAEFSRSQSSTSYVGATTVLEGCRALAREGVYHSTCRAVLFFLWLSAIRVIDAWTTWLLFPFARTFLRLLPSELFLFLCISKALGAVGLGWLACGTRIYKTHGVGGLFVTVGIAFFSAGLLMSCFRQKAQNSS